MIKKIALFTTDVLFAAVMLGISLNAGYSLAECFILMFLALLFFNELMCLVLNLYQDRYKY